MKQTERNKVECMLSIFDTDARFILVTNWRKFLADVFITQVKPNKIG